MNSYTSLSDSLLIGLSRSGDTSAEEELINRYKRKVSICARNFYILGGDREDLIQEAMIGLLKAIRTFDETKGASFGAYSEKCIRARLIDVISLKRYTEFPSIEDTLGSESEVIFDNDPESLYIGSESRREVINRFSEILSPYERAVLERYLQGMSSSEIAQDLNRAVGSVYNAVQRARNKIAESLFSGESSV